MARARPSLATAVVPGVLAAAALLTSASAYPNANPLGALPPRGWATWCTDDITCGLLDYCNEQEIQQVADALGG
jgi:alpha-galactosidase